MTHAPIRLRGYQHAALADLRTAWLEVKRTSEAPALLLVSRTGSGKTVMAGRFVQGCTNKGRRVGWLVRDRVLLDQASKHLDRIGLSHHGVIASGHPRRAPLFPLQICTVQTLIARGEAPPFDVLVMDEAHGAACETSMAIVAAYPKATILGLTATPERPDGQPMGRSQGGIFDRLVQVKVSFAELCAQGALVPATVIGPASCRFEKSLTEDPLVTLRKTSGPPGSRVKKTVIFAATVAHAKELASEAVRLGYRAACVEGLMPDDQRLDFLMRAELPQSHPRSIDVLVNCALLTQGWDCPCMEVLIMARAFGSFLGCMQAWGRVLRPYPGKTGAIMRDLRGSVYVHGHLPGDDIDYSLDTGVSKPKASLPSLTGCPKCGATFRSGPTRCPVCGAALVTWYGQKVKPQAQALVTAATITTDDRKKAAYHKLLRQQHAAGFARGWAASQFQQAYGHYPTRTQQ